MSQYKTAIAVLFLGFAAALGFQNCGSPNVRGVGKAGASGSTVVDMEVSAAQAMISSYEGQCAASLAASSSYPIVASGSDVNVDMGSQLVRASQLASVQGTGNITIYGMGAGSKITSVGSFNGNATLCGISAGSISNSSVGNILVESGQVDSINGFFGNLILLGGSFPTNISHFDGNIVIKTSGGQYLGRSYHVP